ncbi:hypothetical protein FHS76_000324 [Ochrobactrum daejeonense]|uniref:Uncharacterized protein n=1 Tax=Brucella daejeonensis TaxID=659015 RepID=A0A7W9ELA8_9HYPH|nr:hypothetical protein [Brucella daejeonensis]MBB5700486.1 hypothetical protein [Brucella daejeonensis]
MTEAGMAAGPVFPVFAMQVDCSRTEAAISHFGHGEKQGTTL